MGWASASGNMAKLLLDSTDHENSSVFYSSRAFFSPSGKRHNSTNSNFQKMAKINIFGTPKKNIDLVPEWAKPLCFSLAPRIPQSLIPPAPKRRSRVAAPADAGAAQRPRRLQWERWDRSAGCLKRCYPKSACHSWLRLIPSVKHDNFIGFEPPPYVSWCFLVFVVSSGYLSIIYINMI